MPSDAIRIKKSAWVRIVNPDPLVLPFASYRYGDAAMVVPGGCFRSVASTRSRTLVMYQAPHPPTDLHECPSDAMLFATPHDLRLTAEGAIGHFEPYDVRLPEWTDEALTGRVPIGAVGRVPKVRLVRAYFPPVEEIVEGVESGGPFRGRPHVVRRNRLSRYAPIRPGGTMTVIGLEERMLKVSYRAVPYRGEQLGSDAWFRISEKEFLRMDEEAAVLQEQEDLERAVIVSLLRSL